MTYTWVFLSVLSGFGQALGWALRKKALENIGLNNTLGCVSFLIGGALLFFVYVLLHGLAAPPVTLRFLEAMGVIVTVNVIGAWASFRALGRAPLSLLMPFFPVLALTVVPVEYVVRGVAPHGFQLLGMALIAVGAVLLSLKAWPDRSARKALGYFAVCLACFSLGIPFQAVAVEETQSGLFTAAVFLFGIGAGFVPLVLVSGERFVWARLAGTKDFTKVLWLMAATGFVSAFLENAPQITALLSAKASEVFALKRTMPFFALVLGVFMFHEKITRRHVAGTALLVVGSMMVVWFR